MAERMSTEELVADYLDTAKDWDTPEWGSLGRTVALVCRATAARLLEENGYGRGGGEMMKRTTLQRIEDAVEVNHTDLRGAARVALEAGQDVYLANGTTHAAMGEMEVLVMLGNGSRGGVAEGADAAWGDLDGTTIIMDDGSVYDLATLDWVD